MTNRFVLTVPLHISRESHTWISGNSSVGQYGAYYDEDAMEVLTVLPFYGLEGDIMGSTAVCVSMLAACTLFFATCGACVLTHVRHSSR